MISGSTLKKIAEKLNMNIATAFSSEKEGGSSKKRGISTDQVCVLVARDRDNRTITDVATFGRISRNNTGRLLGDKMSKNSMLLTDRHPSFGNIPYSKR